MLTPLSMNRLTALLFPLTLAALLAFPHATHAQITSWIGQEPDSDFENPNLWTNGVPDENSIAAVGPHQLASGTNVILADDGRDLGGLLITDGMRFTFFNGISQMNIGDLNGGGLTVAGNSDSGRSTFRVFGNNDGLNDVTVDGNIAIIEGAEMRLNSAANIRANGDTTIGADSQIRGSGTLLFGTNHLDNNGGIIVENGQDLLIFAGDSASSDGIDLDGAQETGFIHVKSNGLIDISGKYTDAFDGTMQIDSGAEMRLVNFEPQFGAATIHFDGSQDAPGVLFLLGQVEFQSNQLLLNATGHGQITGASDENELNPTTLAGLGQIHVNEAASLTFGDSGIDLQVSYVDSLWSVDAGGVLDFKDTLATASGNQVQLNGGTVIGDGSVGFDNTAPEGIRGYGRFELHVNNTTGITADGGELVVVVNETIFENDTNIDWDGAQNEGALRAEVGDLRLVDHFDATTAGNVRVGGGHTLHVDGFSMSFDGNVLLNGGTVRSEDNQIFHGTVDVPRQSTIDAFAAFEDGVVVDMDFNLHLKGHTAYIDNTATFVGSGDLINEPTSQLVFDSGSLIGVDLINYGSISNENVEAPGSVALGQDLENFGTVNFALAGTEEVTQFDIEGDLMVDGGIFRVVLVNDFNPRPGDQFDLLDFSSFNDNGFTLELPKLCAGLTWETSSFTTDGILTVSGFVLGDVNLDGNIDLLDVAPFVEVITNGGFQQEADVNQDGVVNLLDVAPFIDLLNQNC